VLTVGRYGPDKAGYAQMLAAGCEYAEAATTIVPLDQIFLRFPTIGILMNLSLSYSDRAPPWKA
jgi:hypothetical protein